MYISPIAAAISVILDKPRTLILDFNAFAAFSEITGKELPDVFADLFERDAKGELVLEDKKKKIPKVRRDFTASELRAIVFAGLVHEDGALTLASVGRHLSTKNRGAITNAVFASLMGIVSEPADPTLATEVQSTSLGTGSASGPSVASN